MAERSVLLHFVDGEAIRRLPDSYAGLTAVARTSTVDAGMLAGARKWEPLVEGVAAGVPAGWTTLDRLARTRRGIATGHNDYFLVTKRGAGTRGFRAESLRRCIHRSGDVTSCIFEEEDFDALLAGGRRAWLIDLRGELTAGERRYVKQGEREGVNERHLLSRRSPWYSMEQRRPAPIWAGVFLRGGVRFVRNRANVLSLTNFHGIYPHNKDRLHLDALTCILNSNAVARSARSHLRRYGGGLTKFDPADLLSLPVPDISGLSEPRLALFRELLESLDHAARSGAETSAIEQKVDGEIAALAAGPA